MRRGRLAPGLSIAAALVAMPLGAVPALAEAPARAEPGQASPPITTRVLAIGHLTARAKSADFAAVLAREVPATLALYLAGRIDAWYALSDQTGVAFLLNATTTGEARALLEPLPLGQAGMMIFDLMPVGPLRPLGLLLSPPK